MATDARWIYGSVVIPISDGTPLPRDARWIYGGTYMLDVLSSTVTRTKTVDLDSLLKKVLSRSVEIDAYLFLLRTAEVELDAYLNKSQGKSVDLDAILFAPGDVEVNPRLGFIFEKRNIHIN